MIMWALIWPTFKRGANVYLTSPESNLRPYLKGGLVLGLLSFHQVALGLIGIFVVKKMDLVSTSRRGCIYKPEFDGVRYATPQPVLI